MYVKDTKTSIIFKYFKYTLKSFKLLLKVCISRSLYFFQESLTFCHVNISL